MNEFFYTTIPDMNQTNFCETPQSLYELLYQNEMRSDETWAGDKVFGSIKGDLDDYVDYVYPQFLYYQKGYTGYLPIRAYEYVIDLDPQESNILVIDSDAINSDNYRARFRFFLCSEFLPLHQKMSYLQIDRMEGTKIHIIVNPVDIYFKLGRMETGYILLKQYLDSILLSE